MDDTRKVTQAVEEIYNIHIFDKIQLMEWEDKAETDKTCETCNIFFNNYYQAKKRFGITQKTNHGFEKVANLNEVKIDEIEIMERSHNSEQINAMANTTSSMIYLCAQLTVAKAEKGAKIAQLNTKIYWLTKPVEKITTPTPTTTKTTRKIGHCIKCKKRHEIGMCWEDEKNAARRPPN